jgi:hypothetical protein
MVEKEDVVTAWLMIINVWGRRQKGEERCRKLDCYSNARHSTPLSLICEAENGKAELS